MINAHPPSNRPPPTSWDSLVVAVALGQEQLLAKLRNMTKDEVARWCGPQITKVSNQQRRLQRRRQALELLRDRARFESDEARRETR